MKNFEHITINDLKYNLSPKERNNYINEIIKREDYSAASKLCLNPDYLMYMTATQEIDLFKFILNCKNSNIILEFLSLRIYSKKELPSNIRKLIIPLICKNKDASLIKDFFKKIKFDLNENDLILFNKTVNNNLILRNQHFIYEIMKKNQESITKISLELIMETFYNLDDIKTVYLYLIVRNFKDKITNLSALYILMAKDKSSSKMFANELMNELSEILQIDEIKDSYYKAKKEKVEFKNNSDGISDKDILSILECSNPNDIYIYLRFNAEKLDKQNYYKILRRFIILSIQQSTMRNIILFALYIDQSIIDILYKEDAVSKLYVYINESNEFTQEEKSVILKQLIENNTKEYIFTDLEQTNLLNRFDKYINN